MQSTNVTTHRLLTAVELLASVACLLIIINMDIPIMKWLPFKGWTLITPTVALMAALAAFTPVARLLTRLLQPDMAADASLDLALCTAWAFALFKLFRWSKFCYDVEAMQQVASQPVLDALGGVCVQTHLALAAGALVFLATMAQAVIRLETKPVITDNNK